MFPTRMVARRHGPLWAVKAAQTEGDTRPKVSDRSQFSAAGRTSFTRTIVKALLAVLSLKFPPTKAPDITPGSIYLTFS